MRLSILTASAFAALAACAQQASEPETGNPASTRAPTEPETALDITITPPNQSAATYLITPGMSVPPTADMSRGDVPRDDYGRPYTYEYLGQRLPAFSGPLADGGTFSSIALEGKWTVIEVWGLWCHDSMTDAPYAAALSTALAQDPDVDFITIHTPQNAQNIRTYGKHGSVAAFFDEKGYRYRTLIDTDASVRDTLKIRWTPSYLVIAPDMTVQAFRTGLADADGEPVKDFVREIANVRAAWAN